MGKVSLVGVGLAALLAVMSPLQGCGVSEACRPIGCVEAVRLSFEPALQQEGNYQFVFHLPSEVEVISCATTLPHPETRSLPCSSSSDSSPNWPLAELDLSPTGDGFDGLYLYRTPRKFELEISFDGEVISRTVHQPVYSGVPDDEVCGCAPAASETVKL